MKNNEILKLLPKNNELKSVRLPSSIDFSLENKCLTVVLKDATGNMQENKSAFEGWIICLKSWLATEINKVELAWSPPNDPKKVGHYNRFQYRVIHFQLMYSWFSVSKNNAPEILDFSQLLQKTNLVINYPGSGKQDSKSENKIEDKIESMFVNDPQKLLRIKFNLKILNQQLPVGVFKNEKNSGSRLFTGQKSAIDLWGINDDELTIFELKFENCRIGIISELLFYLYLMKAVFIAEEIHYPEKAKSAVKRDFKELYNKKFQKLRGIFLVDELHPFIGDEAITLINDGLIKLGNISVQKLFYTYNSGTLQWK
jgi:hypothetical protein